MTEPLKTPHPILMVPHLMSFSVVVYTNGAAPVFPANTVRDALLAVLPAGTGLGEITYANHGVYTPEKAR